MNARVLLVGEANPYGGRPEYALYPEPHGCSGWRLCHLVLRLDPDEYLERYERVNLCPLRWDRGAATFQATKLLNRGQSLALLGAKVTRAFGLEFEPLTARVLGGQLLAVLPHPSGLCRTWHQPGAFNRARELIFNLEGRLCPP